MLSEFHSSESQDFRLEFFGHYFIVNLDGQNTIFEEK